MVPSSHLLDEVERTCAAAAIVDRGRSSARAPSPTCWLARHWSSRSTARLPTRRQLPRRHEPGDRASTSARTASGSSLAAGTERAVLAEINRLLVEGDVAVNRPQEVHASLHSWFLEVMTRPGADSVSISTAADDPPAGSHGARRWIACPPPGHGSPAGP